MNQAATFRIKGLITNRHKRKDSSNVPEFLSSKVPMGNPPKGKATFNLKLGTVITGVRPPLILAA